MTGDGRQRGHLSIMTLPFGIFGSSGPRSSEPMLFMIALYFDNLSIIHISHLQPFSDYSNPRGSALL